MTASSTCHDFPRATDLNGNGFIDAQDLIRQYSNGIDDDGNGYVDDIAGWDFFEDDNDPDDDTGFNHGTGRAIEQVGEANNGIDFPGVAPSAMFVPIRVSDSFIVADSDFAQGVVYAVDLRVSLISEALGAITVSPSSQGAIDYAYRRGIPVIASAADEQSRHNNYPSALEHTIWVNSIRNGDGVHRSEYGRLHDPEWLHELRPERLGLDPFDRVLLGSHRAGERPGGPPDLPRQEPG